MGGIVKTPDANHMQTSTILLQGLLERDNSMAWQRFCDRYEPLLMAFARRSGLREDDAHDAVQETLIAFLESFRAGRYDRSRGRLRSWIQGIMFNKIKDARRKLARQELQVADKTGTAFLNTVPDERELPDIFDEEWERAVMRACLREVRQLVDGKTFEAFRLYALENWPPNKVAEHLGISRGAVYVHKSRVLAHLRKIREDMEESF